MIKKLILTISFILILNLSVFADTPMESIKKPTKQIIKILKSSQYSKLTQELREKQWDEIWYEVENSFDFSIISRLAIGKYWKSFSTQQQNQFKELFAELLANTYISKVQENFKNQKIDYINEKISGKKSEVLIHVALENKPIPIIYRLVNKNGWYVYDVKIEGMSMIKNYRSQFDQFLFKKSPKELIDKMKIKINKLRQERKLMEN